MTIKDMIQEGQVTPKEVRALFQEILATYTGKKPISVTVNYGKETVKFDFDFLFGTAPFELLSL